MVITDEIVEKLKTAHTLELQRIEEEPPQYGGERQEYHLVGVDEETGEVDRATIEIMFAIDSLIANMMDNHPDIDYKPIVEATFGQQRCLQYLDICSYRNYGHGLTIHEYYGLEE